MIAITIIIIGIGVLSLVSPETAWKIGYGWRYKNAEPSDFALIFYRIIGVVLIILAVILFFTSISEFGFML
ncbi:MAG: hypothetical protein FWC41_13560 [Firmicutes bacterium]|nr:hypothetical protein [Bacillota bacterium]